MGFATAVMVALAVLALCTALLNLWAFAVRRRQPEHLWLAVASFGVLGVTASYGAIYEADSPEQVLAAQLSSFVASVPLVFGFLRFTSLFAGARFRALERAGGLYGVAVATATNAFPAAFFKAEPSLRSLPWNGSSYWLFELEAIGSLLFSGFFLLFAALATIYWRARDRFEESGFVVAAVLVWIATGLNDALVAFGLLPGPFLVSFGYAAFAIVFTGILMRRFVQSMDRVEASAVELGELVEERTAELREKDLQIAHGSRMATVGALAAGLAHEINNPMAFISANLGHLHATWRETDGEEFDEVLDETLQGIDRIRGIVDELQRLARHGEVADADLDLSEVIENVLPIVRHEARGRARLETRLCEGAWVRGDDRLLGQVILNLVVNALHAIPEGDPAANRVRLSTRIDDGSVWLVVEDSGAGIPKQTLPHIFDPFFTTKPEGEGTGLGLAVTHQIVDRHRGRIDVESAPGRTAFTIELPAIPGAARSPATGSAA